LIKRNNKTKEAKTKINPDKKRDQALFVLRKEGELINPLNQQQQTTQTSSN